MPFLSFFGKSIVLKYGSELYGLLRWEPGKSFQTVFSLFRQFFILFLLQNLSLPGWSAKHFSTHGCPPGTELPTEPRQRGVTVFLLLSVWIPSWKRASSWAGTFLGWKYFVWVLALWHPLGRIKYWFIDVTERKTCTRVLLSCGWSNLCLALCGKCFLSLVKILQHEMSCLGVVFSLAINPYLTWRSVFKQVTYSSLIFSRKDWDFNNIENVPNGSVSKVGLLRYSRKGMVKPFAFFASWCRSSVEMSQDPMVPHRSIVET